METNEKIRQRAEKRVEELRGFYIHCVTYFIVNLGLFGINFFLTHGHWWFIYPLLGWGIGLVMNGVAVWKNGFWGEAWRERKIAELIDKG